MPTTVGPSTITINHDRQFLVSSLDGSMTATQDLGFFGDDTRYVSGYALTMNGQRPVLLNSAPIEHFSARYEFMSPALPLGGVALASAESNLPERTIGLRLDRTIREGVHEDYVIESFASGTVRFVFEIAIESDFADVFDVRSHRLVRRGDIQTVWWPKSGELRSSYENDSFRRDLLVRVERFGSRPAFANGRIVFTTDLEPKKRWRTCLLWLPVSNGRTGKVFACGSLAATDAPHDSGVLPPVSLDTSHPTLPAIWRQAVKDIELLRMSAFAASRSVFVPAAGVPWYVTLFGRDSLIVAMESISGFPEFAQGALERLSRLQATDDNAEQDKEPGKMPHEVRSGEIASLGLLPWSPYYGTHDATPLFIVVLSYAYQWSGDRRLLDRYRTNAEAAYRWMTESGDRDGDGFLEYRKRSSRGLDNQGWKDSWDSIRHADGSLAEPPIALCEIQGYAFDALLRLADMYDIWDEPERGEDARRRAWRLYERFNNDFWWESEGTYYLGLDGDKQPIRSVASNAGHCLQSGIVPADRAGRVVDRLMAPDMFSGWGVRTLSAEHPSYNPYSYHIGSVWPHDNATLAGGFRRAGRDAEAGRVAGGILAAAERFEGYRLPELFAGLEREPVSFPVQYLGANVPQAWAAASVFRFVAILCGIHTAAATKTIHVNPALPDWLPDVTLRNLRAGRGAVDLHVHGNTVDVLANSTGYDVRTEPPPRPVGPARS